MTLLIQESEFKSVVFSFGCHKCIEDDDDHVAWPAGPGRVDRRRRAGTWGRSWSRQCAEQK